MLLSKDGQYNISYLLHDTFLLTVLRKKGTRALDRPASLRGEIDGANVLIHVEWCGMNISH